MPTRSLKAIYRSFDLPVATIRPFNTYGPRQSARAVVPTIISQAFTQKEIRLGSLDPVRDLTYVKDTVEGFIRVAGATRAIGETINIGSGSGISIGDLARRILGLMGVELPIVQSEERLRPESSEVFQLVCNNSRATELCGWAPRHGLDEGLRETIDFVRTNLDRFKPSIYAT